MSNKDKDTKQEEYNKDYEYAMAHPQVGIECKKHSCFYHPLLGCHYCGKYAGMNYYQFKDTKECCKKCKDKLGGSPELGYVPQCLLFGNCSCHKPFEAQEEKAEVEEPCCPHGNTTNNCPICEPHTSTGCSCDKCLPQSSDWNTFGKLERKIFEICNRPVMGEKWSVMQSCYDIKNLISSELSIAKKEVEHCGEKNCPECNLKAFNAGKKEERERIIKFIEENLIPIDAKNAEGIAHRYMAEVIRNYIKNLTTNQ